MFDYWTDFVIANKGHLNLFCVPLLDTGFLSDWELFGLSLHAGQMWIGRFRAYLRKCGDVKHLDFHTTFSPTAK